MKITSFEQMEAFVKGHASRKKIAVACAHDDVTLEAVLMAVDKGVADAILIGKQGEIEALLRQFGKDPAAFEIIDEADERAAIDKAVAMVRAGTVDIPMKGLMHTATFMRGILDKQTGLLEPGELLSQASVFEVEETGKMLIISDCAVNIEPNVDEKCKIVENAVKVAKSLGIDEPKIAMLSALEVVNPKIQGTVDAAEVTARLKDKYQIDGPFALDNAVSKEAARHKGIDSSIAGKADILIVPDMWSGNIFTKGLVFFAHMKSAGTLNGLRSPVVMTSRTDIIENKYFSILTAVLQSIR